MALKIKIKEIEQYFTLTRNIKVGDIFDVVKIGKTQRQNVEVNCYLYYSENGKALVAYESEVELIEN